MNQSESSAEAPYFHGEDTRAFPLAHPLRLRLYPRRVWGLCHAESGNRGAVRCVGRLRFKRRNHCVSRFQSTATGDDA